MNYRNIFRFIDKCIERLNRPAKDNEKASKVFLFSEKGAAVYLKLSAGLRCINSNFHWHLSMAGSYGYRISECAICTSEDPCEDHQTQKTRPLNAQLRRDAWRARELFPNSEITVPEPIYPQVTRGFDSLAHFREKTKDLYPKYSQKDGWTSPPLEEGLGWSEWNDTKSELRFQMAHYPKIIGYSPDGKIEYSRNFSLFVSLSDINLHNLTERLPKSDVSQHSKLIEKLNELLTIYWKVDIEQNKEIQAERKLEEQRKLDKERQELAPKFNIDLEEKEEVKDGRD